MVVSADIAKETHVARNIDFPGIELVKYCVFSEQPKWARATDTVDEGGSAGSYPE